nr:serine/threonine-protein kinase PCRK1-like [Aegilops tauschii subsp. strangulata]
MKTGHLSSKHDVWGYGVLLYELITGRRPVDGNRPKGEQKLLDWVRPYVFDIKSFPTIIDPRLEGFYDLKSMIKLADVANRCLRVLPKARPKMSEVYEMVQRIVDRIESGSPEPRLHYHGLTSEPGEKQTMKGSLKRIFREFKFGYHQRVWRRKKSSHPKEKTIKGRFADKIDGGAPDSSKTRTTHSYTTSSLLSSYAVGTETSTSASSC